MATNDELNRGIRCTVTFVSEGVTKVYEHATIRFEQRRGGVLEVPMEQIWATPVGDVTVTTRSDRFYIPAMEYREGDFLEKESFCVFHFDELLWSFRDVPPEHANLDRIEVEAERLGLYLGHASIEKVPRSTGHEDVVCKRTDLHVIDLPFWNAKTWINADYNINHTAGGGYDARPNYKLLLDLEESVTHDRFRSQAYKVASFWEFMTHRPLHPGQMVYRSKNHGSIVRHLFKETPEEATGIAWFQSGLLQMPWIECAPHLERLMHLWLRLDHDSAWMENLMRVIRFREMPADIRFFMAYTALQGFGDELGVARPIGPKLKGDRDNEEERVWKDFEPYWRHLLFTPLVPDARAYTNRMVRTRHHFAHRSKGSEDIFRDFREHSGGYFRLTVALKVMLLKASGVPETDWKRILEQWAVRIQFAL